jgi:hypothetical protein
VFTHRGLSPHQFTPMSGAHISVERMAAGAAVLQNRVRLTAAIAHFFRSVYERES